MKRGAQSQYVSTQANANIDGVTMLETEGLAATEDISLRPN